MEQIINACRSFRHAACLRLLKETGMRIGEVTRLQFKDFDFERKTVRVMAEKGSRPRELRLGEKLVAMVQQLFARKQSFPTSAAARHYLENTRKILADRTTIPDSCRFTCILFDILGTQWSTLKPETYSTS